MYQTKHVQVCGEMDCFYYETIFKTDDLLWMHQWDDQVGDLVLIPLCPSCGCPTESMTESDFPLYKKVYKDGTVQTVIQTETPTEKHGMATSSDSESL